jgi:Ca2+-binding RTX toxin-like protein
MVTGDVGLKPRRRVRHTHLARRIELMNIGNAIPDVVHALSITNTVHGTWGDDHVHISRGDGGLDAFGFYRVEINGRIYFMKKEVLEHTRFDLGPGNDTLLVDGDVDVSITADGGSGNDLLIGGCANDWLSGGIGNDWLCGGDGNDRLSGGSGDDYLDGGAGCDHYNAGSGSDAVEFDLADLLPLLSHLF